MAITSIIRPPPAKPLAIVETIVKAFEHNSLATGLASRFLVDTHVENVLDILSILERVCAAACPISIAIADGKALIYPCYVLAPCLCV